MEQLCASFEWRWQETLQQETSDEVAALLLLGFTCTGEWSSRIYIYIYIGSDAAEKCGCSAGARLCVAVSSAGACGSSTGNKAGRKQVCRRTWSKRNSSSVWSSTGGAVDRQ